MPVPPPECSIGSIQLPEFPNDPPDVSDVCKATMFAAEVRAARRRKEQDDTPTDADVCSATVYQARVLSAYSAAQGAPILGDELAAVILGRLDDMEARMGEIDANLGGRMDAMNANLNANLGGRIDAMNANLAAMNTNLGGRLEALQQMVGNVRILATKSYNLTCGSGLASRFAIMPLPNGQEPPADLPRIENVQDIRNLERYQLIRYINAYGLELRRDEQDKRRAISAHIGCSVDL
ncbi:hypothetical protein JB92DRAFT_62943 [Gautieria morchelliformis]|nr:hypothetical protein JB92DRAFT_62943 [Gautieria morchelliformis]